MITIIDYGAGNIGSIRNMLKKIGYISIITSKIEEIESASHIILPGVGSFDFGMKQLKRLDLINILTKKVIDEKTPFLGICLGMQLLAKSSEEGELSGLGWFDADVIKFNFNKNDLKVPHMGWNTVTIKSTNKLMSSSKNKRFYFVHSYYFKASNVNEIMLETTYGIKFTSAIFKDNIFGVQFHPEKSHKFGMKLLSNFISLNS
tara:strand:- start:137 stop:748 length:612 start_codon:yes stop_codon:yes gene_type:complete